MSIQKLGEIVRKLCWKMVVKDVFGIIVSFHLKVVLKLKMKANILPFEICILCNQIPIKKGVS
jgi:hypothetical protein